MTEDLFTFEELLHGDIPYDPAGAEDRYNEAKKATVAKYTVGRLLGKAKSGGDTSLKKLSTRHYQMIALHLKGIKQKDIATEIGVTLTTVWKTLNDPLSRQIIETFYEAHKVDLMGLFPVAVDVIRTGLNSADVKTGLLAVDRFVKLTDSISDKGIEGTQVNITIVNDARKKLVLAIRQKIPTLTENTDGSFSPEAGEIPVT